MTPQLIAPSQKQAVLEVVARLPDDVTLDAIASALEAEFPEAFHVEPPMRTFDSAEEYDRAFRAAVDEGLRQLDAGLGIPHEELKLGQWRD